MNQIGKYNVNALESIKDLYLHDFGIFIEMAPDEEETTIRAKHSNVFTKRSN